MTEATAYGSALRAALKERWAEVRQILERAVADDASDAALRVLFARALVRQGFAFKAIDVLEATPGLFDDAGAAAEAGAELGILLLKLGRTVDAEETFRRVLACAPDAARAHAGLGHLYRYRGEVGLAAQAFVRAEDPAVIRDVEREIAPSAPTIDGVAIQSIDVETARRESPLDQVDRGGAYGAPGGWVVVAGATSEAAVPSQGRLRDSLLALPAPAGDRVFSPSGSWLGVRCAERVFSRLPRIVCADAHLAWVAETAHVNGQSTDRPLGGDVQPIYRIEGDGHLTLAIPRDVALARISLAAESLYVNEDAVFGFGGGIEWENGALELAEAGTALSLLFLEGTGEVLLAATGGFTRLPVERGHSVSLAAENLVGWTGRIVPSAIVWNSATGSPLPALHLSGEGTALIALAPGIPGAGGRDAK
jgi:uncharacterized protein (AIM24 family)